MSFNVVPVKKKKCMDSEKVCVFCNQAGNLVLNPKPESYLTIYSAADRRKDEIAGKFFHMFDPNQEKQTFSWHGGCLSSYISEEKIRRREILLQKTFIERSEESDNINDTSSSNTPRQSGRRNFKGKSTKDICSICCQKTKKRDDKLFLLSERLAAEKFLSVARDKGDEVFTRICTCETVEDLFAQEVRYHRSCLQDYTYIRKEQKIGRPDSVPRDVLQDSLNRLLETMGHELENKAFELTYLTNRIVEISGVEDLHIDNKITRDLLIDKFGEKVLFSVPSDRSKSSIMMVANITMEEMAERLRQIDNPHRNVTDTANKLREEILQHKFPCDGYVKDETVVENSFHAFHLPPNWAVFMKHLLTNKKMLSENKLRRAKSIFMDLHFSITGANNPKHVALAHSIHHLTRSKNILTILFKLGHCISYQTMHELDEELWRKVIFENQSETVPVPANIITDPSLFLHGAIDNNDFCEETLSGKNTTHVTAMVLYQENKQRPNPRTAVTSKMISSLHTSNPGPLPCQKLKELNNFEKAPFAVSCVDLPLKQISTKNYKSELVRIATKTEIDRDNNLRLIENSQIPGWSPFQQILTESSLSLTSVGFCPIIPQAPTSYNVVFSAMVNFMSLCQSCGKQYGILTADMSIYLIAKRIQMQNSEFKNLTLRIGSFHLQKVWLRCIGQYLEGSGIETIITEDAAIYGENTFQSILNGNHYNRGVRAHKLLYEALRYLQLSDFVKSVEPHIWENIFKSPHFQNLRETIADRDDVKFRQIYALLYNDLDEVSFFKSFTDYLANKKCNDDTVTFYTKYCEMVEILLDSIKADRECDFDLHMSSVRRMLPYFFSMNHYNYARGVTLYLEDMHLLPDYMKTDLKRGMMSVKRSPGTFNAVACDLALEQSQIRSSAISGGLIGITTKKEAMEKWILLYPTKNAIYNTLLTFCNMHSDPTGAVTESFSHNEWSPSRIKRDDNDLKCLIHHLMQKNLFTEKPEILPLHNICNGKLADEGVASCLLKLQEHGEELLSEYLETCFKKKEKSPFHHKKSTTFRNFTFTSKEKVPTIQNKIIKELNTTKETLNVQKIIMWSVQRNYNLKSLSSHELSDYPRALTDKDGFMKKPAKHMLVNSIEKEVTCAGDLRKILSSNNNFIHIFDGMGVVFNVQLAKHETFGEFCASFYNYITLYFSNPNVRRIDIVFDRYDDISIKYMETKRRSRGSLPTEIRILSTSTRIPANIKNFLCNTKNKQQLVTFLCQNVKTYVKLKENQELIISGGFSDEATCWKIQETEMSEIRELRSNHTEADTRIFAHAFHAARSGSEIIIHSSDTDVFVLGVHFWPQLKISNCLGLWMKITSIKSRILGCHLVAQSLGTAITSVLPAVHAFTGCDTTSKISSKYAAFKQVKEKEAQDALKPLGNGLPLTKLQITHLEQLYLKLINKQGFTADDARYICLSRSFGFGVSLDKIPCTSNALNLHSLRASAQTYIWLNAFKAIYEPLDFSKFGYKEEETRLVPNYITRSIIPDDLTPPCYCRKHCATISCTCKKNNRNCIPLCFCVPEDCRNKP